MKKRILMFILALCLLCSLTACGKTASTGATDVSAEIVSVDPDTQTLVVKDLFAEENVFGDGCTVDCSMAVDDDAILSEDSETPMDFSDLKVGDQVLLRLPTADGDTPLAFPVTDGWPVTLVDLGGVTEIELWDADAS